MATGNLWSRKLNKSQLLQPNNSMPRYFGIYEGTVMDNADPEHMGRILVYIPELGGSLSDKSTWFLCNYASPFGGATSPWPNLNTGDGGSRRDGKNYVDTQTSYGFWVGAPDVDNQVLVGFVSGDPLRGYYFACVFQKDMNHMIPGIASGTSYQGDESGVKQPVAEYNKNMSQPSSAGTTIRASHPLRDGLKQQGLSVDGLRGVTTSSARRESPSKVYGMLTPGGSQFVMDDGDPLNEHNAFIRLRTVSGSQIVISETYGHIYLISKDGNSWVELNNEGHIDVYSSLSISMHSDADINMIAGQDVNIQAGRNINMKTLTGSYKLQSSQNTDITTGGSFKLTTSGSGEFKIGSNLKLTSVNLDLKVDKDRRILIGGDTHIKHPNGGTRNWGEKKSYPIIDAPCFIPDPPTPILCKDIDDASVASPASTPSVNIHTLNKSVTSSIGTRVPEHEPWAPHTIPAQGANKEAYEPGFDPMKYQDLEQEYSPNDGCELPKNIKGLTTSLRGKLFIAGAKTTPFVLYSVLDDGATYRIGYSNIGPIDEQLSDFKYGITENDAWGNFERNIVQNSEKIIKANITVDLMQSQFDALSSLVMDLGVSALTNNINGVRLRDLINDEKHEDAATLISQLGGNSDMRRKESILYKTCNYTSLGDRCTWLKKAISEAKTIYTNQSDNIKRQIQGSFYRMNQPNLPSSSDYLSEIKSKYPQSEIEKYISPCTIAKEEEQRNSGTVIEDNTIKIGKYHTLKDFTYSSTAKAAGISNQPTDAEIENLKALAENVIDPFIDGTGCSIKITSGYRSPALNEYLASGRSDVAKRSQHSSGQAVDFVPVGMSTVDAAKWIKENLQYDQLIHEARSSRWVHVSWNRSGNRLDDGRTKYFSWNTQSGVKYYGQIVNV